MMGTRHMRSRRAAARRRGNTPALLPMPRQHRPLLSFGARPAGLVFDVAAWFAGARQGCAGAGWGGGAGAPPHWRGLL